MRVSEPKAKLQGGAVPSPLEPGVGFGIEGIDLDDGVPGFLGRLQTQPFLGVDDPVAEAMAEILEVWSNPCEPDIPMFEGDWLDAIPEDAIDPDLLRRYRELTDPFP